jgi:putative two-component system response regulator
MPEEKILKITPYKVVALEDNPAGPAGAGLLKIFYDKLTWDHVSRIQWYLLLLVEEARRKGVYADEISKLHMESFLPSAQLHDVGKFSISDLILNKPAELTAEEYDIMKTHVTAGVNAIEKFMNATDENAFLQHAVLIAGTHHEKWDGSGYPLGLQGLDIPIEGRLMAIADVYDALVSERPYKKAFTHQVACEIIERGAGGHFDPLLVEVFRAVAEGFAKVMEENGEQIVSDQLHGLKMWELAMFMRFTGL